MQRMPQRPLRERAYEIARLDQRYELAGRDISEFGRAPPTQRLDLIRNSGSQRHFRLEVQLELAPGKRRAQQGEHPQKSRTAHIQRPIVDLDRHVLALGAVEGNVSALQQQLAIRPVLRI